MQKYYPPEGFLLDPNSGMFYRCHTALKPDGTQGNFVVWFNAETGQYTQPQEYGVPAAQPAQPVVQAATAQVAAQPVTAQPAATQSAQTPNAQPVQHTTKKKASPLLPLLLVVAVLVGVGYFLYQNGTLQEYLPFLEKQNHATSTNTTTPASNSTSDADASDSSIDSTAASETANETDSSETPADQEEPVVQATAEPTEAPSATSTHTVYTGAALTSYVSSTSDALKEVIGALWNQCGYTIGNVSCDFSQGIPAPCAVQSTNCQFLRVSEIDGTTTYEGLLWAGNSYNVTSYMANPYWFIYTTLPDGSVTLDVTYYSDPNAYLTASYSVANEGSVSYTSNNVLDRNASTAWSCDGRLNESLTCTLNGEYEVYGFAILNGYWKNDKLYNANGKAGYIASFVNDEYVSGANLYAPGYNSALANAAGYDQICLFEQAVTADEVSLMITAGINGNTYDDICISELLLLARPVQ